MSNIQKILVPLDFSNASKAALKYAANLCGEDASKEVMLLKVLTGEDQGDVKNKMEECQEIFSSISKAPCKWELKNGELIPELIKAQEEGSYDLIVMGTKGSQEEEEVAISNTSKLVLEADAPVLVIPESQDSFSINNVALALGRNEIDDSFALGILHNIARDYDAKIHVLTIEPDEISQLVDQDNNESILEYYFETLDYRYSFPKNSDIEIGISEYVKDRKIDLLAILPRNHAKKSKPSEGRLTKLLTLHTEIPLLTID
jgi:nucleotide-binding universal stress UspA family protein